MNGHATLPLRAVGLLAFFACLLIAAPSARASDDDFEFAGKLAAESHFEYARMVYDAILADESRSDAEKDEARYGLALLAKEEAFAATAQRRVSYRELLALFEGAANDVLEFAEEDPTNENAQRALLDAGTIRLTFVQWACELLNDPTRSEEMDALGVDAARLREVAREVVAKAIQHFESLRPAPTAPDPKQHEKMAAYYCAISQYYRALVEPPCSPAAMEALAHAGKEIEAYIFDHDGSLLALYAQDFQGLVRWEMAKCEDDPQAKADFFNGAFEWFETCIYADDLGPDYLRVITSGYYHLAQAALDAGHTPQRDYECNARKHLEAMLERHPTAWQTENGLRAMVEHSKLECRRGHTARAIDIAQDAAEYAERAEKPNLEWIARQQTTSCVLEAAQEEPVKAEILRRVADDLYVAARYTDAVHAYRSIITSTPATADAFMAHHWHAWERMARSYFKLGDRLGEALAYEPVHEAWMRGWIPYEKWKCDDANMDKAGHHRRRAQCALRELADITGSAAFHRLHKTVADGFMEDYPAHVTDCFQGNWNTAIRIWKDAIRERDRGQLAWRKTMDLALDYFVKVSKDASSPKRDAAHVYMVRCDIEQKEYADALKQVEAALAFWNSKEAKEEAAAYETVRVRRHNARGAITYWKARAERELGKNAEALVTLEGFQEAFPNVDTLYHQFAYDTLFQAHLELGNIEEADRNYSVVLTQYPTYYRLRKLTFALADHHNAQRRKIESRLGPVLGKFHTTRRAWREAEKEVLRLASLLVDLRARWVKAAELNAAEETVEEFRERIRKVKEELKIWALKRDTLSEAVRALSTRKRELERAIYIPLISAARYYEAWDDTLKASGAPRDPRNVLVFADMFYRAGRLRPDVVENWEAARELYEDYLGFPEAQASPEDQEDKRGALERLGLEYAALARREQDADKKRKLATLAVEHLERVAAKAPSDTQAVLDLLGSTNGESIEGLSERGRIGFDPHQFSLLGNVNPEFRLALASAYLDSGDERYVARVRTLVLSLVVPPLQVEADTEQWWRAREIQFLLHLKAAEYAVHETDKREWLRRAGQVHRAVGANYPEFGEEVLTGNCARWAKHLERLNGSLERAGLPPIDRGG